MKLIILIAVVILINVAVWYYEEVYCTGGHTENQRIDRMVKADLKAQKKRGDIDKRRDIRYD